jgi:hypothetical protein
MSLEEQPLSELLNREPEAPVITEEWLEALLDRQFPGVLKNLEQKDPVPVAEFVKLAQMEREMYPRDTTAPAVFWVDSWDDPLDDPTE